MDVHEYLAKELLANFGVVIPRGLSVAFSPDQAVYATTELSGWHWAVKAQIHAGQVREYEKQHCCREAQRSGPQRP